MYKSQLPLEPNMDLPAKQQKHKHLTDDLTECFLLFSLAELETTDEIHEGIDSVGDLGKQLRHLHIDLKDEMGDEAHGNAYPKFNEQVQQVRDYVTEARKKLKTLKVEAGSSDSAPPTPNAGTKGWKEIADEHLEMERKAADTRVRNSILVEESVFRDKLQPEIADVDKDDLVSLEKSSGRFEFLLDDYYKLLSRAKIAFGDDFDTQCKTIFDKTVADLRKQLKFCKSRSIELSSLQKEKSAQIQREKDKQAAEALRKEQMALAEILSQEIEARAISVVEKCNYVVLDDFDDFKILECSKNLPSIDIEMREILSKFTEFSQITAVHADESDSLVVKVRRIKENSLKSRNSYAIKVYELMSSRDISEEKLKKSSSIEIDLSKFEGYGSKLDIYSFKTQYEDLVQKKIQKAYWLETLKKNYLSGPALVLVDKIEDIEEVWKKLISSYGNVKLLLQNKMSSLDEMESLDKIRGNDKVITFLSRLINTMLELSVLAQKHNLEGKLYIGGGFEKVLCLIGRPLEKKFLSKISDDDSYSNVSDWRESEVETEKRSWKNLLGFLKKELAYRHSVAVVEQSKVSLGLSSKSKSGSDGYNAGPYNAGESNIRCHICSKPGHVLSTDSRGNLHCDYVSCKMFVDWSCKRRKSELYKKKFCFQCLSPGVKHFEAHNCCNKYVCPDDAHKSHDKGIHVLLCGDHKSSQANVGLLQQYMKNYIEKRGNFEDFTKNISLICISLNVQAERQLFKHLKNVIHDTRDRAIFPLQTIIVEGKRFRLFYDRGAGDAVIKWAAIRTLQKLKRAERIRPGPIPLSGVSDMKAVSHHGVYSIALPLKNGDNFVITGITMDKVTAALPEYDLSGVEKDVQEMCRTEGGDELVEKLPKLANKVGGDTDILLGSKYLLVHPKEVWRSDKTGLSVADSFFASEDGSTGVINGPHPLFTEMEEEHWRNEGHVALSYYTNEVIEYRRAYELATNASLFGEESDFDFCDSEVCGSQQKCLLDDPQFSHVAKKTPKCVKTFDEIDSAGTEVSFRCIDCRGCETCKKSERVDAVSFEEEIHEHIIEKNVDVDLEKGKATALLPFVTDPDVRIDSVAQKKLALKIYESQVKALVNKPEKKQAAILSESKLQELGYVDYLHNLPQETQDFILKNVHYFIPWRLVFNENSVSTPCRLVMDASASPRGQPSINSLLVKGCNRMNKIVMIILRWFCWLYAFHSDISKMYNTIYLDPKHWRYQLYFWNDELKVGIAPVIKVVETVIYGVRPSGNIAGCALRRTAELTKDDYPEAYDIIMKDIYVDDCLSGKDSEEERSVATNQFSSALIKANFKLKGITYSGSHPPPNLANEDGISVTVGGQVWFSKDDTIGLKIPVADTVKRGKFVRTLGKFQGKLNRRDCVSAVYEIFDPSGKVAPIVGGLKIDLHELVIRNLDWDDVIPENLRQIWESNFEMIQELRNIRYKRAVVPPDAVDTNIETLDFGDASLSMICVAVYVRFKRKSGDYSCQLLFSRTKTVPKDMTLPRAELLAASINTATGHVVKTALGDRHVNAWKFTDSQVTLHWIHCFRTKLKMFVRNLVIHIHRLSSLDNWRHIDSGNMIADLGTRRGATLGDVGPESPWINGHDWMHLQSSEFPAKTIGEVKLSNDQKIVAQKEEVVIDPLDYNVACISFSPVVPGLVKDRYKVSQYILDPNKFRFRKVIRVKAWVFLFTRNCLRKIGRQLTQISNDYGTDKFVYPEGKCVVTHSEKSKGSLKCQNGLSVELSATVLNDALHYYFVKATLEVKHFLPKSAYQTISEEKQGVLFYTGRILPTQQVGGDLTMCDVSFDLTKSSFCVPIVDRHSPVAFSVVNEVHWYHPDVWHAGVESALRKINSIAYVIGGRGLVRLIKDSCTKCRKLWKEEVKIAMGPKDASNLCVAPAFYNTQVDVVGHFDSYSNANKRAKLKIWFCVFCCSTTGAVDCKIMDDYSTEAFILAFIRFACRFGYPGNLYPDAGSQLLKGCKDMRISFSDVKYKLSVEFGVDFHPCPVGSHYYHGKVERKIQEFRKSVEKVLENQRLSLIQWETLGQQICNSINNMPIGLGNKCASLENLDLLTPNRLILGRNNSRCPTAPLVLSTDVKKIIQTNADIFNAWFRSWLVSYVPTLVPQPKWFETTRNLSVGDVVLFSKSDKEFENVYQYGMVKSTHVGRDGLIRSVEVEYQNPGENTKRVTKRGARELIVIHPYDELGLSKELFDLAAEAEQEVNVCHC